jgi:hypothetical protein
MASLFELAGSVKEAIFAALHAVTAKPFRVAPPVTKFSLSSVSGGFWRQSKLSITHIPLWRDCKLYSDAKRSFNAIFIALSRNILGLTERLLWEKG